MLFAGVLGGMGCAHFDVEPPIHQLLQTCLAAKMFCRSIVRHHIFPGVDFEHMAL
jgi:hypothetical protein